MINSTFLSHVPTPGVSDKSRSPAATFHALGRILLDTWPRNFFLGFAQAAGRIMETAEGSAKSMPQIGTIEYILAASIKIQLPAKTKTKTLALFSPPVRTNNGNGD